jgi:hypothetical protein
MSETYKSDPRKHCANACEPVQIPFDKLSRFGQDTRCQPTCDKGQLCMQFARGLHISEGFYLAAIDKVVPVPEITPRRPRCGHAVLYRGKRLINYFIVREGGAMTHVHVVMII